MRAIFLAVVLATTLLAGAAAAGPRTVSAAAPDPLDQTDVSRIIGTTVYDSAGNRVGDVATVLMNPQTRRLDRFVVRVITERAGGIFGIGGRLVAVPIDSFSWSRKKPGFVVSLTRKELRTRVAWSGPSSAPKPAGGGDQGSGVQAGH